MGKLIELKNKKEFKVVNKTPTVAEITIYSDIGESFWGDSISAKSFNEELKSIDPAVNEIHVRINSPGGDVFDGITIYNRLKQHKAKVKVYIDGLAASIASIIALAGDEVIFSESALMMIHKPWTFAMGNANELLDVVDRLDDIEEQLVNIYKKKSGKDRAEIKKMMAEETWFDAQQAIEHGFADSTMDEDESIDIAASLDNCKWMKNTPKMKSSNDIVGGKVNELLKEVGDFSSSL